MPNGQKWLRSVSCGFLQGDLTLGTRWMDLYRALFFTWLALQLNSQSRRPRVIQGGSLIKHSVKHQFVGRPLSLKQKHKQGSQTARWKWCKGWVRGMAETSGWSWTSLAFTKSQQFLSFLHAFRVCISSTSALISLPCLHSGSRTPQGRVITC